VCDLHQAAGVILAVVGGGHRGKDGRERRLARMGVKNVVTTIEREVVLGK